MKVAHVITQMELGGAQQNTLFTVTHLDRRRFEPILAMGPGGLLLNEALQSGVQAFVISGLVRAVRPWKDLAALIRLYRLFRKERPDVVHTHSSKAGILGRWAAYAAGVPVILHTFHGFGFNPVQKRIARTAFQWTERLAARLSTALIVVSEANRRQALRERIGREERYHLIRSGIDRSLFEQEAKSADSSSLRLELQLPAKTPLVTLIGNLKPQKNPLDFVKMAARVASAVPEAHFLLVGDGTLRKEVEALRARLGLADRLHLLGWRRDIARLLHASDIFALTSRWEGLPRAAVEAMVSGLPVVAYAVDGLEDIIQSGHTGTLVPAGDVDALADGVTQLLRHPERAKALGKEARKAIQEEFDINRMVQQQEELYDQLLKRVPAWFWEMWHQVTPSPYPVHPLRGLPMS